ncbi:hypothetical protein CAG61_08355 [Vibrio sp. V34_P3A8T189]|uniref:hypothetical protein n=1 Tax=unclassified Vibrio TaxID=2614977 RepID=UPI0013729ECD|nr:MULTISPECIES: hypothetical protein [unclassified Vibrio]NAW78356.1 hypothetical protein [Vibrio sp. V33_P6A3T137]NAX01865.1 hypothetical protein [Vibrio sp. V34_P3A8T189]NAX08256.1 hypothetical protein [Vibrio sp. V40_P2S30T141]
MVTVNKTRVKKLKDALQAQLNLIAAKYSAEHHELDCDNMTKEDYEHYIALDQSIEFYREMLGCNDDVVIVDNL